ncbi:hypothetical protein Zmor_020884 [Zophobas morio]|uniref:Uncharacterized protein n=1 Tax=Zophobas morio TaxID=2755281 RepID=A0AA38I8C5_9CUCU|nr:hypothetical protein Zmor_020884 [Zophobas morio]
MAWEKSDRILSSFYLIYGSLSTSLCNSIALKLNESCAYTRFEVPASRKFCITKIFQGRSTLLANGEQLSKFFMDESRCEKSLMVLHCVAQPFPMKKTEKVELAVSEAWKYGLI